MLDSNPDTTRSPLVEPDVQVSRILCGAPHDMR